MPIIYKNKKKQKKSRNRENNKFGEALQKSLSQTKPILKQLLKKNNLISYPILFTLSGTVARRLRRLASVTAAAENTSSPVRNTDNGNKETPQEVVRYTHFDGSTYKETLAPSADTSAIDTAALAVDLDNCK